MVRTMTDPTADPPPIRLQTLGWRDPLRWLAAGWRDFRRAPLIGLFYGAAFVVMGWMLAAVYQRAPAYVMALAAGFLLMGPFLCLGLYHVSRSLERGPHEGSLALNGRAGSRRQRAAATTCR